MKWIKDDLAGGFSPNFPPAKVFLINTNFDVP